MRGKKPKTIKEMWSYVFLYVCNTLTMLMIYSNSSATGSRSTIAKVACCIVLLANIASIIRELVLIRREKNK